MCAPAVLAPIAIGMTVAGGIFSAQAQAAAGRAQQGYYNYQAEINRQQAAAALQIGEQRATLAESEGALESGRALRSASELAGAQKAVLASNNVGGSSVTAQDIYSDTFDKEKLDQIMIRYNADVKAHAAKTGAAYEAFDYENQAKLNQLAGRNARKAGNANAIGTLLGTAGSVANSAYSIYGPRRRNPAGIY